MKKLLLALGALVLICSCAVYKDKQGVTHYEFLPPATGVYVAPYYPAPAPYPYGYWPYYPYYGPYYGPYWGGYYGRYWR
jgi:hypothetical protein